MSIIGRFLTSFRDTEVDPLVPGLIQRDDGTVWLVAPDGTESQVSGGGSQPAWAYYGGNTLTIADGADANLTWDFLQAGTDLLDRSDLANPVFLAGGLYAIAAAPSVESAFTAAGGAIATLLVAGTTYSQGFMGNAGTFGVGCSLAAAVQCSAGDALTVFVNNVDGAASRDFALFEATIVKFG